MIYYIIDSELYKPIIYYQFYNYFTYHQTQNIIDAYLFIIELKYNMKSQKNIIFYLGLVSTQPKCSSPLNHLILF
jgi:hypothetical protein